MDTLTTEYPKLPYSRGTTSKKGRGEKGHTPILERAYICQPSDEKKGLWSNKEGSAETAP